MAHKKDKNLTLRFISYNEIKGLPSEKRIKIILDTVIENKIVILQGKLEPIEEASLIQSTMALIGRIKGFRGVELATIQPEQEKAILDKIKTSIAHALLGQRDALTVIGPAAVVKEIRKNPSKIDLMLKK
ncbi:MAG: DUF2073 domain-containing protein [Candidatus Pacearchaeota archaeon]